MRPSSGKQMLLEPRQQRRFVERQRFGRMPVLASRLSRRAAGIKDSLPLLRLKAGQHRVFESAGRNRRNLSPVLNSRRRHAARIAKQAIGDVVVELQPEKLQGKLLVCGTY